MPNFVLGIDPSITSFGWVVLDTEADGLDMLVNKGRIETYSTKEYREARRKAGSNFTEAQLLRDEDLLIIRHKYLEQEFRLLIRRYDPVYIGTEAPPIGGGEYSEGLYALYVQNMRIISDFHKDVVMFAPEQLKLLAFEFGRKERRNQEAKMEKNEMVAKAREKVGMLKGKFNNDEADAFHCAYFGHRFFEVLKIRDEYKAANPLDARGEYLGYGSIEWEERFKELCVDRINLTQSEIEVFLNTHTYVKGEKAGLTEYKGVVFKPRKRYFFFSQLETTPNTVGRVISDKP